MSDKEDGLILERRLQALLKQLVPDMNINSWQRIIKEIVVMDTVHSPCQTDPLLLASTEIDAALSNLSMKPKLITIYNSTV